MQSSENSGANWSFKQESVNQPNLAQPDYRPKPSAAEPVQWTASEFIAHHKDARWYSLLVLGFIALSILIYLITRDIFSIVFIGVALALFSIIASKKPRQRMYEINNQGILIDAKFYPYGDFKTFSVSYEDAIGSIIFNPLRRLMPELTVYFAPQDEDKIVNTLLNNLPFEEKKDRAIDKLTKRLHF